MPQRPFRFLHAANLQLDRPAYGLTEAPAHLLDALVDCPLQAAARLFDSAIDLRVSFVVLSGNTINPELAAPRELNFLVEQFNRLAERKIAVYWSGDFNSALHWPAYISWPANVKLFPVGSITSHNHELGGSSLCQIFGGSSPATILSTQVALSAGERDVFRIGLTPTEWNAAPGHFAGINYWAFGSSNERRTHQDGLVHVHCPGTHQGRTPAETGPRGGTLVSVDEEQRIKLRLLDTDVARWETISLQLPKEAGALELEQTLFERAAKLREENASRMLIVDWKIECSDRLRSALRQELLASELTAKLNSKFGHDVPIVWTNSIRAEMPAEPPGQWRQEQTLRSDFLKAIEQLSHGTTRDDPFSATLEASKPLQNRLSQFDLNAKLGSREQVLQDATWLGLELLSPPEARL